MMKVAASPAAESALLDHDSRVADRSHSVVLAEQMQAQREVVRTDSKLARPAADPVDKPVGMTGSGLAVVPGPVKTAQGQVDQAC